jgi:adenosylmethionine-8-amino-7-oxononanoate aminotransferase
MLDAEIEHLGPERVAAFVAEPIGGAASGAAMPPAGYWEAISAVCERHGILIIADEVMTGFGRTGEWFASTHFGLVPDIMTMAKGASSGYWPLGICAFSRRIADSLTAGGFVHGFTYSHDVVGAAAGSAVLKRIDQLGLVERARRAGPELEAALRASVGDHPLVGDIRGIGLLWAVELVADRTTNQAFPAAERVAHRLTEKAREHGLVVYPSTGCAGDGEGDLVMIGPPLIVRDDEIEILAALLSAALDGMK